jgi:ferredoxin
LGFIAAGRDPLAIDSLCARIIGLDPHSVPILRYAAEAGIGNIDLENIEVVGDDWQAYKVKDFKNYTNIESISLLPPSMVRLLKNYLTSKPAVDHKKCTACKKCIQACPLREKAIFMKNGRIRYDYRQCIRCFCCQEICPEGAIYIKESVPWKILSKVYKLIKG